MIVNLNTLCKVQLNETGKKIWLNQIKAFPKELIDQHPEIIEKIEKAIDKDGCIEIELWGLMNVFGLYMSPATPLFTTSTIEINKNPNFGNYFNKEEEKHEQQGPEDSTN